MGEILEWAERAWAGDLGGVNVHPGQVKVGLEVLNEDAAFMSAFSNALVLKTGAGLAFVDTSSLFHARALYDEVRHWTDEAVHTGIYTHGHVDHVFGLRHFHTEAEEKGRPPIRIVAHTACPDRFDRYQLTAGYNGHINARQFGFDRPLFPTEYRYPDERIADQETLEIGDVRIELYHDRGETDDGLWAYLPAQKAVYTGDLFIWAAPNCGNPQKAQRYPREWAAALRKMAKREPEQLFPGHGPPILGADRVAAALGDSATLLETITEQTLSMMNAGAKLDDILHSVELPSGLLEKPYLRPIYDDPIFIVRTLWRLYGGWYDGNPAHLKPSPDAHLARALAAAAGGAGALAEQAQRAASDGDLRLACELAEFAWLADPENETLRAVRAEVYAARARAESSLMAKGIYAAAARDMKTES